MKTDIKQCTQDMKTIENNVHKILKQYKTMYTRYENNRKQCTQDMKTIENNAHKILKQ